MAYIVSSIISGAGNASTFAPNLPLHVENDLLLVGVSQDGNTNPFNFGFTTATLTAATDLLTATSMIFANGDKVVLSTSGSLSGTGLTALTTPYWVRDVSGSTFKLAETPDGAAIDITGAGTGTHTVYLQTNPTTGWAFIGIQAQSGANRSAWLYKIAGATTETDPTITSTLVDDWIGIAITIRDADTTNPFGSLVDGTDFARGDYTGTTTAASPAVTTTNNENLLIYSWSTDNAPAMTVPIADLSFIDSVAYSTAVNMIAGWTNQYTAGAVPSVTMTRTSSTNGGNSWVLAVKNKSGGGLRGECTTTAAITRLYGAGFEAGTYSAPNSVTGLTAIDSVPVYTATELSDQLTYVAACSSSSSVGVNSWVGGFDAVTKDLTGAILSVRWSPTNTPRAASQGFIVVFVDSTNKWKAFRLARNQYAQMILGAYYRSFIDIDGGTPYATSETPSTFDSSDVVKIGWLYARLASATTSNGRFDINPLFNFSSMVFVGGNDDTPANAADIDFSSAQGPALTSYGFNGVYDICSLQGAQQLILPVSCQFGDGSTPTYVGLSGASIETPLPYAQNYLWNVADNKINFVIYAGASDTIDLSSAIIRANSPQNFTIHASSNTGATYSFQGASIIGWDVTWKTGIACVGAAFKECDEINFKGADVTNCTITDTASTDAAVSFDTSGATVTSTTIDGIGAAYAIELGTAVTAITLASCTITAGSTDKIHVLKTTGTVTITISGTTSLVAGDVTSEGATVVISAPELYQSVTISGLTAGSRVQIYDYGVADTELYNDVVAGTSVTWTDTVPADSQRDIRVRIAYVDGTDAKEFIEANIGSCGITEGTEDVSYLANQVDDSVYITNGIDGSAVTGVTFTDTTVDVINIDLTLPVDIQDIYAAWVYYAFTETGIASDIDYIEAVDIANYILSNLIIKNTTSPSVPLKLVGGYFWDATTGDPMDCIDTTGGTIFLAPPHVVPKIVSTSSSVVEGTPATVAAAVLSAAQSTPIYADIRKVNNYTVVGDGETGSEWNPA